MKGGVPNLHPLEKNQGAAGERGDMKG